MYRKTIGALALVVGGALAFSCAAFGEVSFKVNGRDMREGQVLSFSKDDLDGGKLVFTCPADDGTEGAEISLDNGRTWEKMERQGPVFAYTHRPRQDERLRVAFLFRKVGGATSIKQSNCVIDYQKMKPDEAIMLLLQKMKDTYEAESLGRFMDLISMRFPNRVKFDQAIQNDFYSYTNIRLYYRIDRQTLDPDGKGAIWDVYWERQFMNRNGANFKDNQLIPMKFDKEQDRWLVAAMNNNTIFGSSQYALPELVITSSDITRVSGMIRAVIHNIGGGAATGFNVQFYQGATVATLALVDTQTVAMLAGSSDVTLTYATALLPVFYVRVVIDPAQRVPEANRSNNEATAAITY